MNTAWNTFEDAVKELRALESLDALAGWDSETYMPPKAAELRSVQRAAMRGVIHEKLTSERLGQLLDAASQLDLNERQTGLVRVVRRDREREMQLPARYVT